MIGIRAYGGYVPRYRLKRELIYKAMGWINSANIANSRGEKAVANFDEDSITMAVAAGMDALAGMDSSEIQGVYFASTTMPYKERLNASIISAALGVNEHTSTADFSGSLRAGTTALLSALDCVGSKRLNTVLATAADCRLGKPASAQEMIFGDASAAFVVGDQNIIAEFKNSFSVTYDFGDHYRGAASTFDDQWEDRWIRDIGFDQILPEAVNGLLNKTGLKLTDFDKIIYPCHYPTARNKLNKKLGISPEMEQANLQLEIGESGVPHSLVMLANALEDSKPGDKIMLISYGSGSEALYFEITDNIMSYQKNVGISWGLANKANLDNYNKMLVWRNILAADFGKRMEEDNWTRFSAMWRRRHLILGLYGGKCTKCGTPQMPAADICVNPKCGSVDSQVPYRFADKTGYIASYTGDNLAASLDPPAIYAQIEFDKGGKFMFDLTDCNLDDLSIGMPVKMSFRRKYYDSKRDISGYFWKATPVKEAK